jgi:hypothetical protein
MGHDHHHGESVSNYFTEQLLTILVCGLLGFAAIQLYLNNMLDDILVEQFRAFVLAGGIGVFILVALRAIAVWKEAGEIQAQLTDQANGLTCAADHVHGPDCDHDPGIGGPDDHAHDHEHGHSHDMSWTFARMLILVFPVGLFFLGLPNGRLSADEQLRLAGGGHALGDDTLKQMAEGAQVLETKQEKLAVNGQQTDVTVRVLKTTKGLRIREITLPGDQKKYELVSTGNAERMRFNDLNDAAFDEAKRKSMEGRAVILEGRFKRLADKEFTLFRLKMTCCAADTVPLKVQIIVPQPINNIEDFTWVRVKGQLQFFQVPGSDRYIPVVMVAENSDAKPADAQNEYEQ